MCFRKCTCTQSMYSQCCMYPTQSWVVTIPKAIANNTLVAVLAWNSPSFALMMLLTWLNNSSNGIKSGEYGGRKISFACATVSIWWTTGRTWWIAQLSITTTDRVFVPLNGFKIGSRVSVTNSSNLIPFTELSMMWTSCTPSNDITAIPEYLTPWIESRWSLGGMPQTK